MAIRPDDEVLTLETMYFSDEIRSPSKELPDLPSTSELTEREISMAQLLVESMESEWDPTRYHDTHREKVHALVEAKRNGDEIVIHSTEQPEAKVVDLMDVLSASIESVKAGGRTAKRPKAVAEGSASKKPAPAEEAGRCPQSGQREVTDQHYVEDRFEGAQSSKGVLTPIPRRRGPRGCRLCGARRRP